jgi:hypothetical protein
MIEIRIRSNKLKELFWKPVKQKLFKEAFLNLHPKKSDAQVGRVNTFHILQNIRK